MGTPSIVGTYQLIRRELPDGTVQVPPMVKGMFTYTGEFRNFSVLWQDDQGKFFSVCYVARYTLTDTEYSETSEYVISDDQIHRKGIRYDLSHSTAMSPVSYDGKRVRFALPQPFEKVLSVRLEFEGPKLTATAKDQFVDYWEKVS